MDVINEIEILENDVKDVEKKCSKVNNDLVENGYNISML